ncbi:hypothetical protein J2T08_000554 [Neorhizobium galegae]|nr:hypothetical protein [Neorhizobium galegae]MDQ0132653.1 hypothetical protein [Neorhizobium galegae]
MLGLTVKHSISGIVGIVEAVTVDPSGAGMVRIDDKWFMASDCGPAD